MPIPSETAVKKVADRDDRTNDIVGSEMGSSPTAPIAIKPDDATTFGGEAASLVGVTEREHVVSVVVGFVSVLVGSF
ncbi:hypothetical protein C495_09495 [Natronorubrum sulfidifaciens JCM 14089]|uniref:Uncharacterized protein n=1 Tax=Natronorubrum sulfidifaciens JCM 14089 TaxID=1230460 RepID=L9W7D6_9EURY|nr:hypothetical protein C495_09495 [Natronorubrum sulfidifaciens JCM 14089]